MPVSVETVFDIRNVSYFYEEIAALRDVSLRIKPGERVALLGPNGSGKSTLLRLLAALAFPRSGEISFLGEPLTEARLQEEEFFFRFRRGVGVVFQNPDVQLFNASVFDEIAFGLLQLRWPKEQIRARVTESLRAMGIEELKDRAPYRLSGGEKKRVALASVLVTDPELLLLDEPIAGLDPNSQTQIVELLRSWENGAKTVVIATHDLDTLEDVASYCYVLDNGSIAGHGTPFDILHNIHLLKRTNLIHPYHHVHKTGIAQPHPHLHADPEPRAN